MTGGCWRCGRRYDLDRCALPASWDARNNFSGQRIGWAMLCGPCTFAAAAATQLDAAAAQVARLVPVIRVQATIGRSR